MTKRFLLVFSAVLWLGTISFAQPKYVFYLIGDGMGLNAVQLTELYLAAQNDAIGVKDLCFESFPVHNYATSCTANNIIPDSAASGTSLATGEKTNNRMIGVRPDGTAIRNIAEMARDAGRQVGIVTSDGMNGATPSAFTCHQKDRDMNYSLQLDMLRSEYDVFAGSKFSKGDKKDFNPEEAFEDAGYAIVESREEYDATKWKKSDKLVILPPARSMPYYIDRPVAKPQKYLPAPDMLRMTVDFFMRSKESEARGFFIMAEGGHIDHCAHANDAAGLVKEMLDFNMMVEIAYSFYLTHPDETLVIVTADHETGGVCVKCQKPEQLRLLDIQAMSLSRIGGRMKNMMKESGSSTVSWDEIKNLFRENLGFWDTVSLTEKEEEHLYRVYENTLAKKNAGNVSDPFNYSKTPTIVYEAVKLFDKKAGVEWGHNSHTAAYVPLYAVGVGQENFLGRLDNTDIAKAVIKSCMFK